jgi:hypothetical protein
MLIKLAKLFKYIIIINYYLMNNLSEQLQESPVKTKISPKKKSRKKSEKLVIQLITNPKTQNLRPTFYINSESHPFHGHPVTAAGIVFYKVVKNYISLLMVNEFKGIGDFGGKVDTIDSDIQETASREAMEESNNIFDKKIIYNKIKSMQGIYIPQSKYNIFSCKLPSDFDKQPEEFGDIELFNGSSRTIKWINIYDPHVDLMAFHPRLRYRGFRLLLFSIWSCSFPHKTNNFNIPCVTKSIINKNIKSTTKSCSPKILPL